MKKLVLFVFLISVFTSFAQKDEVNKYLRLVAYGKIDEVRAIIPDLLAKYPNDPGVKLLHGTILDDAFLALDVYQSILKNYPESEWADHAYWRIVQFYAVLGDTNKAMTELANFRTRYPSSSFIGPAADVVRSAVNLTKKNIKNSVSSYSAPKSTTKEEPVKSIATKSETAIKTDIKNIPMINPDKNAENVELKKNTATPKSNDDAKSKPIMKEVQTKPLTVTEAEKNNTVPKNQPATKDINNNKSTENNELANPTFFGLQVGIYKDNNTAESEKNKFLVRRLRTQVVEKEVNGTKMYAVVIGHYSSLESAEEGKKIVSIQCGCEPIIYKK
jgi:cell division protein FtsN